jgi:hypothetical protein
MVVVVLLLERGGTLSSGPNHRFLMRGCVRCRDGVVGEELEKDYCDVVSHYVALLGRKEALIGECVRHAVRDEL